MSKQEEFLNIKKTVLKFKILVSSLILLSIYISYLLNDIHWIERIGKLIVALSLLLTYLLFKFELHGVKNLNEIPKIVDKYFNEIGATEEEIKYARAKSTKEYEHQYHKIREELILNMLFITFIGEILAGFGSLIFSFIN